MTRTTKGTARVGAILRRWAIAELSTQLRRDTASAVLDFLQEYDQKAAERAERFGSQLFDRAFTAGELAELVKVPRPVALDAARTGHPSSSTVAAVCRHLVAAGVLEARGSRHTGYLISTPERAERAAAQAKAKEEKRARRIAKQRVLDAAPQLLEVLQAIRARGTFDAELMAAADAAIRAATLGTDAD